jgi:membrane fusion protein (multidrug efflux system)
MSSTKETPRPCPIAPERPSPELSTYPQSTGPHIGCGLGARHDRISPSARRPWPRRRTSGSTVRTLSAAIIALTVALTLGLTGCGKGGNNAGAQGQARAGQAGQNGRGQRPAEPAIPVAVESARVGPIASYYTATATLTAEKEAEILARVTGVIQKLTCEEGDFVQTGDALLQIEDDEYRLRLRQAEANRANLQDRHNRLKGMFEQQLVSAEEYESATNEFKAAEAAEELARLELSYSTVRAPFSGRIVQRLVDPGQNVGVGTPLFVISDFDPLLAVVHVPSKEFKRLKPNQPVQLVLDSTRERLEGRIKLVSPVIDPASGTIKVTVEIPKPPAGTRPGDFAEVRIVTERREESLLVPKISVFTDRGDRVVYVASDSTAERRVVDVGFEDDVHSEILAGVTAGEGIVVKGQRSLKHGAAIKILAGDALTAPAAAKAATDDKAGRGADIEAEAAPAATDTTQADSTRTAQGQKAGL